ncbi:MAG: aldo/keto reductase [Phycisphaerae bacterium]|nr:aldo/keto reductase [Phycisphaerae bacterium]
MRHDLGRRDFLRQVGAGVVGGMVGAAYAKEATPSVATRPAIPSIADLPTRKLGRAGIQLPPLSFGSAAMGHAFYAQEPFEEVACAALDAGVRYFDTAVTYDVAEERLAPILAKRRKEIILAGKSRGSTRDDVLRDVEGSLKRMRVDYLDVGHLHNVGQYDLQAVLGKGGSLEGMLTAKERGLVRHVGCTGHLRPHQFIPVLETGHIEVIMVAMNFVDQFTYGFEEKVLPTARRFECGIICMKVYGGVTGGWDGYRKLRPGRLTADEHRQNAFDYALSIPGVATCVVGLKSLEELRLAIEAVRRYRPLEGARRESVFARGEQLAAEWGFHLDK